MTLLGALALAQEESPPCDCSVVGGVACGGPAEPRWGEDREFHGPGPPPNPRGEPCALLLDRMDAAKDQVSCSARAAEVARAWIPDIPAFRSPTEAWMVWVDGLDVTALWRISTLHSSEAGVRTRDPREADEGALCTVLTVLGPGGVPILASATCGALARKVALARRYCPPCPRWPHPGAYAVDARIRIP